MFDFSGKFPAEEKIIRIVLEGVRAEASLAELVPEPGTQLGPDYEQPEKSISAGMTVAPGVTFSGFPFASRLVVFDGGVQVGTPPLNGACASARME